MYNIKGDLDLYIYHKSGKLVKHHTQSNYDTLQARLEPDFDSNVNRITRFDYEQLYNFPRQLSFDQYADLPIVIPNETFVPSSIIANATDDGYFAISYDMGSNWYVYDGTQLNLVTINNITDLRNIGMSAALLNSIPEDTHFAHYQGHILIRATPNSAGNSITGFDITCIYDHRLLDPYYARWFSDLVVSPGYKLEGAPISTSMSNNVYTINVSNLSGANPIIIDTIYTTIKNASKIGTFTYVGVTVEPDHILTGTYTITVDPQDEDMIATRNINLFDATWGEGRSLPDYTDGVLGGIRYDSNGTTRLNLSTYNGGPVTNSVVGPFLPDDDFRKDTLNRAVIMEYSTDTVVSNPYIDSEYAVQSTGNVSLYSYNNSYLSKLSGLPSILKFRILSSGDSGVATYQVWFATRLYGIESTARNYSWVRWYYSPDYPLVTSSEQSEHAYHTVVAYLNTPLKNIYDPNPWGFILYGYLGSDGEIIPEFSCNPFYDLIVETFKSKIVIKRYASDEVLLQIEPNTGEEFFFATATYEDLSGHDLHILSFNPDTQIYTLSSLPVAITRDMVTKTFSVTVNGDLTERYCTGNIHDATGSGDGSYLYYLLRIQETKGDQWTASQLMTMLKSTTDNDYIAAVHEDIATPVDDNDNVIDQKWNYRHLVKYGNVTSANDNTGDQIIEFDGTSMAYLKDTRGITGLDSRLDMQNPTISTYVEYRPSSNHDATVLSCRGCKLDIDASGEVSYSPQVNAGLGVIDITLTMVYSNVLAYYSYQYVLPFIDPNTGQSKAITTWSDDYAYAYSPRLYIFDVATGSYTEMPELSWSNVSAGNSFRWLCNYMDPADSHHKLVGIDANASDPALAIVVYDFDTGILDKWTRIDPDGLPGSFGYQSYYSIRVTDTKAILYIFGRNMVADVDKCVCEVDLTNKTATFGSSAWTQNDGPMNVSVETYANNALGINYTDRTSGDNITMLILAQTDTDWDLGTAWFFNHTTRTSEKVNMGTMFNSYGDPNNIDGSHNLSRIDNRYVLLSKYNRDTVSTNHIEQYTVIDLQTRTVVAYDIGLNNYYGVEDTSHYSIKGARGCIIDYPIGHDKMLSHESAYPIIIQLVHNTPYRGGYTYSGYINMSVSDSHSTGTPTYSTASDNSAAIVDLPGGFSLVIHDDGNYAISGSNAYMSGRRTHNDLYPLNTLNIGGYLSYSSGDVNSVASYTASSLYTGAIKNLVIKKNSLDIGPYRFQPRFYDLADIESLSTNFTGDTTLLFQIKSKADPSSDGIYFLDTANNMNITKVTDTNLGNVTPNTITEINSSLTDIKSYFGNDDRIGFFYYDINGNAMTAVASQVYVKFTSKFTTISNPNLMRLRRTADYIATKNGHYFMHGSKEIVDQTGHIIYYVWDKKAPLAYLNVSASPVRQYSLTHDNMLLIAAHQENDYTYNGYSSMGDMLLILDKLDHFESHTLGASNIIYGNSYYDVPEQCRVYMSHDPFEDILNINVGQMDLEQMVAHRPSERYALYMMIPARAYLFNEDSIESNVYIPLKIDQGEINTTHPFPIEAPDAFTLTSSASVMEEWCDLYWYFQDGSSGISFVVDEVMNFAVANTFGFTIDNWQIVNSFNVAQLSGDRVSSRYNLSGVTIAGTKANIEYVPGEIDNNSLAITEPIASDKFFVIFGDN